MEGDFGKLAGKIRGIGPDVPDDPIIDGSIRDKVADRGGEALMSPRDYLATCVPKKGMVELRDVFGSSAGKPATSSSLEELEPTRTNRDTSLAESFNTFGPRHRQPSTESTQEDDDEWSYTLSAYGSDNDEDPLGHRRRRQSSSRPQRIPDIAEPFPSIPPHLRFIPPETDSPLSLPSSELVTPNSHITELPRRSIQSITSDTPTPRAPHPFTSSGEGGGLQLDFAPKAQTASGPRNLLSSR